MVTMNMKVTYNGIQKPKLVDTLLGRAQEMGLEAIVERDMELARTNVARLTVKGKRDYVIDFYQSVRNTEGVIQLN